MHAGEFFRRCGFDCADFGMRMGAAKERGVERSGQADIVDEPAAANEQRRVLLALDRGSEPFRSHARSAAGVRLFRAVRRPEATRNHRMML